MVRPKCVLISDLLNDKFETFLNEIVQNEKVVPPSAQIWRRLLQQDENLKMTSKALYNRALRWWKAKFEAENEQHVQPTIEVSLETSLHSSLNSTTKENSSLNSLSESPFPTIKFSFTISNEVWKTIEPNQTVYRRQIDNTHKSKTRTYYVLKPGIWTNVISDRIADSRKNIICDWAFNRGAKVYPNGSLYVVISAKCVTCQAVLLGGVETKPTNDSDLVKFSFTVTNFNEKLHQKKEYTKSVKNGGIRAREYFTSTKSAITLRRERLRATTKMFQKPKGRQFTANAIRCGQYRNRLTKKLSSCPYTALEYLQNSFSCAETIQLVSRSPFYTMYRSPSQLQLYNAYRKCNSYVKVSCDASGGFGHKLDRPGGKKSGPIYLYCLVISDEFQVAINSMLSEIHHTNIITFWLSEWIRLGATIPNEYVSDMSLALLGAAVRSFTKQNTIADYNDYLYEMHITGCDRNPGCYIRIDIAHFMKNVARCKPLSGTRKKHKDFFIRCVASLVEMTSISQAEEYIYAILIVALSNTEGSKERATSANSESYFKDSKAAHKNIIPCRVDTFITEDIKMLEGSVIEASQKYITYIGDRNLQEESVHKTTEIETTIDESSVLSTTENKSMTDGSDLDRQLYNLYHPPQNLEDQCVVDVSGKKKSKNISVDNQVTDCIACTNKDFPTGAHSCHKCGKYVHVLSGCSNSVKDEEGFGEQRICVLCSIVTSNRFQPRLQLHRNLPQYIPLSRKRPPPHTTHTTDLANEMNYVEKWKRKKTTKQSSYLKPVPNWDLVVNVDKRLKIGMLSNGNVSKTTYNVNGKAVALRNTCAFDATVQILAAAYAYHDSYRSVADNSKDTIFEIAVSLAKNDNLKKVNGMRATLLHNLFQKNNCNMVVTDIISKALRNTPSYTEFEKCSRKRCKYSREENFSFLSVDTDVFNNDFKNLEKAALHNFPEVYDKEFLEKAGMDSAPEVKCKHCDANVCMNRTFGDHIFIEVPVLSYSARSINVEIINEVEIDTLPLLITFGSKQYVLFGLILYHPPLIEDDSGHYAAAVRINNSWQVYDDLKVKPYNIKNNEKIVAHFLFYTEIKT